MCLLSISGLGVISIFCVRIVSPIEPKIIIPIDANNSNLTNAELT